ncbi:uncharacterized protein LOC123308332 isoform X4 [Coccinella septempunctata]|uniref:uncharacterized protein LOC123308332 isoform X4 n=1 Tax=Coccinella septempunctata TaxID=41139 RepID=UPI001D088A58|nr:uncharacterized protein LOC123308332 isoform X4 [Coccinella septempunctata]
MGGKYSYENMNMGECSDINEEAYDDVKLEEQFIDEEGVHKREEYITRMEKNNPNSLIIEEDKNQLSPKKPQILDSLVNNSPMAHLDDE